jgi:hypothetical protein
MINDIDDLLEKYWDGNTTLEEEVLLKNYFKSNEVIPKHTTFKPLFDYFEKMSEVTYPDQDVIKNKNNHTPILSIKNAIRAIAAVLVLIISATQLLKIDLNSTKQDKLAQSFHHNDEIEDPEEALRITKQALAMVSQKINKSKYKVTSHIDVLQKADIFK